MCVCVCVCAQNSLYGQDFVLYKYFSGKAGRQRTEQTIPVGTSSTPSSPSSPQTPFSTCFLGKHTHTHSHIHTFCTFSVCEDCVCKCLVPQVDSLDSFDCICVGFPSLCMLHLSLIRIGTFSSVHDYFFFLF